MPRKWKIVFTGEVDLGDIKKYLQKYQFTTTKLDPEKNSLIVLHNNTARATKILSHLKSQGVRVSDV